jgi:ABC-type polysaccharide/polyol phosphate export permease
MIYDSSKHDSYVLDELKEVIRYRDLIALLAKRDITTRYKRSVLGIAWTMLNPLGMTIVLSLAFSQLFKEVPGYPAYVLSGMLVWQFFSQTTTASMVNLVWGGSLLHRIYLPRTSFALAAIITGLVNLLIAVIPLILVMVIIGLPIKISIVFMPLPILLLAAFALGTGLLLSTIAVYFPDVSEMYQIILTAWMYLTPIFYPESILPENIAWLITRFNPVYHLIRLFRACIYEGRFPYWGEIWPAMIFSTFILVIGWVIFSRKSDDFSYRI